MESRPRELASPNALPLFVRRLRLGLDRKGIAKIMGTSESTVRRIENEKHHHLASMYALALDGLMLRQADELAQVSD